MASGRFIDVDAHQDEQTALRTGYCPVCYRHFALKSNKSYGHCPYCGHHVVLYEVGERRCGE